MMTNLPTTEQLLHGDLVNFTGNHKDVATNTIKIAKSLGIKHSNIIRSVRRLIKNGNISQLTCEPSDYLNERGKSYKYYELGEVEALQVVMALSGKKAEQLQKEIAQGFVRMKLELHDWQAGRLIAIN